MNSPHSINPTPRNSQNPGTFTPLDSLGTLDGMVDYPLSLAIRRAFILQDVSLKDFHSILSHSLSMNSINAIPCLVSGTPDLPRWAPPDSSPNASSDSELDLAFTALFTLPGVPSIYYGDEIGMTGDGLPFNRAPLPPESSWTDSQRRRFDHTASLARLHREHPSLRRGDFLTLAVSDDAIVYCRTLWKESIVIALNRSPKEAILEITLPPNLKGARSLEALVGAPDNSIPIHNNQFELRLPPRRSGLWKVIGKQRPQQQ